jgi:hypothetical protein
MDVYSGTAAAGLYGLHDHDRCNACVDRAVQQADMDSAEAAAQTPMVVADDPAEAAPTKEAGAAAAEEETGQQGATGGGGGGFKRKLSDERLTSLAGNGRAKGRKLDNEGELSDCSWDGAEIGTY